MNAGPDTTDPDTTDLDELTTEDLRERAFALAAHRHDVAFFWSVITHLPHADDTEQLDGSPGLIGATISDAISLWREFTGHGYGDAEPLLRAAFIDYLIRHSGNAASG
jgi:hypothetical protein